MKAKIWIVVEVLFFSGLFSTYLFKKVDAAEPLEVPNAKTIAVAGYNLGDVVTDFKLKNIDGKVLSLSNFTSAKGFIVVFTSNHCPFSKSYEDRVVALIINLHLRVFP